MDKILELLKIFLEKYIISTVIAIAGAVLTIAIVPTDYWLAIRLDDAMLGVLAFCIIFVIIEFAKWLFSLIKIRLRHGADKKYLRTTAEKENRKVMEMLWTKVDSMSPQDYEYLMQFINNNNSPIATSATFCGDCLFSSELVVSTTVKTSVQEKITYVHSKPSSNSIKIPIENIIYAPTQRQYKLRDDFYNLLKYSYENFGRISHFNKEVQTND